jgi:Tfp pilus assembly pilus retraction ATPase PilT
VLNAFDSEEQVYYRTQFSEVLKCIVAHKMLMHNNQREVIYEIVLNNSGIKRLITEKKLNQLYRLIESYKNLGMRNYNMSLAEKVISGEMAKEDSLLFSDNSEELLDYFNRGLMNE